MMRFLALNSVDPISSSVALGCNANETTTLTGRTRRETKASGVSRWPGVLRVKSTNRLRLQLARFPAVSPYSLVARHEARGF